jgi:hypothetical protein
LIEEVRTVHQRQRHACDGVFSKQSIDVLAHQGGSSQAHRLDGEALGFQPLGQERNLSRSSGAVRAFKDDQIAAEFR